MHQPKHQAQASASPPVHPSLAGEITFASPEAQVQRTAELLGAGAIVVVMAPPASPVRGRLAEHLDDVLERELGARGAPSPYLTAWSAMPDDAEARLADQLFRARTVGATTLAIAMGSLAGIAKPALTPEDSATLLALARAARSGPLVVMLDDGDLRIGAYEGPVALGVLFAEAEADEEADADAEDADAEDEDLDEEVSAAEPAELVETAVDAPVAPVAAPSEDAARKRATAGVQVSGPSDFWRSWAIALGAARGPQPLAAFQSLFVESYMPLANAIACGVDDPRALRAHDEFREGFARSYTDAFATFGATGRRPRLVMDAFDVASKQARLHNARTTQVLVVDALRYDLGLLVRDQIATRAAGVASLTSEALLWSALPTTTFRQLETLARGMDALRAPSPDEASDSLRGRSAETVRRMRVGSRELHKLDVVPAMLGALADPMGTSPARIVEALAEIAEHVTDALIRHIETLPPRTLLLVLGDHGFSVDRKARITHGGATPEEVLVPCLAYLVGDVLH